MSGEGSKRHQVYLIPGFFGFSALGGISYFRRVRESLSDVFVRRGQDAQIIGVSTLPTASIRERARQLLRTVEEHGGLEKGVQLHFVGHSTGALDARLLSSPGAHIGDQSKQDAVYENLETVVSVSGPHYGTPIANFFSTLYGKNLLYLVTLVVIVGLRGRPVRLLGTMLGQVTKVNDLLGLDESLLEQVTDELLRNFNPQVEQEVRTYMKSILKDRGSMVQLTPEGMDLFNATTVDHDGVRYVSYATAAPPPSSGLRRFKLRHLLTPLNKVLYAVLWVLASRAHEGYQYASGIEPVDALTGHPLPFELNESTSDGVVPTLSQVWGEFRGIVRADHLDVVGHYLRGPFDQKDGADWFGSGTSFDRVEFEWLWEDVAHVCLRADGDSESPSHSD